MLKIAPYLALSFFCTLSFSPSSIAYNLNQDALHEEMEVDDLLGDVGSEDIDALFGPNDAVPSAQPSSSQASSAPQQPSLVQGTLELANTAGKALSNTSTNVQAVLTTPNAQTIGTAITDGVHDAVNVGKTAIPVVKQGVKTGVGLVNKGLDLGKSILGHAPGKSTTPPAVAPQNTQAAAGVPHTGAAAPHSTIAPAPAANATHHSGGSEPLDIDALLK